MLILIILVGYTLLHWNFAEKELDLVFPATLNALIEGIILRLDPKARSHLFRLRLGSDTLGQWCFVRCVERVSGNSGLIVTDPDEKCPAGVFVVHCKSRLF